MPFDGGLRCFARTRDIFVRTDLGSGEYPCAGSFGPSLLTKARE
jgi:hypothetical protein